MGNQERVSPVAWQYINFYGFRYNPYEDPDQPTSLRFPSRNTSMKNSTPEQAMQQVLQAERDAEAAMDDCERQAQQVVDDARASARNILARANQRITHMEMRNDHKLNRLVKDIDKAGTTELSRHAGRQHNPQLLQQVVEKLAAELCQGGAVFGDQPSDEPTSRP